MENLTRPVVCPHAVELAEPPQEIGAALVVLSGKWKILTLWQLLRRPCRFGELQRSIPGISQHMLTVTLRELEEESILTRTVFPQVPPRVEYALTVHGMTLASVMKTLGDWGKGHILRPKL